jgi:hypothetical protein
VTSLHAIATLEKVVSEPTSPLLIQVVPFAFYPKQPWAEMGKNLDLEYLETFYPKVPWAEMGKRGLGGEGFFVHLDGLFHDREPVGLLFYLAAYPLPFLL